MAFCENEVELLGGGCVGGLDGVDVDLTGRCRVGVTESGGYRRQGDTGVDHQRGVRVAEAVDGDVRQIVRSYEITEPTPYRVRMDRHTVRLGEQAVAIYPSVAHAEALLSLPAFVLLEQFVMMPSCGMYSEARSMRMTEVLKSMSFHSSPQSSSRRIPVNMNILIIVLNCISSPSISSRSLLACSSSK